MHPLQTGIRKEVMRRYPERNPQGDRKGGLRRWPLKAVSAAREAGEAQTRRKFRACIGRPAGKKAQSVLKVVEA